MKNSILICLCTILAISCNNVEKTSNNDDLSHSNNDSISHSKNENDPISKNEDDFYNVMAMSGLKMRVEPGGKKILTVPYNAQVNKINNGKDYGDLTVTELEDFEIKGKWIKVKYDGKEGFVFDGYLTKLSMPKQRMKVKDKYDNELEQYLGDYLKGTPSEKFDVKEFPAGFCEDCESCAYSRKYGESLYTRSLCNGKTGEYYAKMMGVTLTEAYFIIKALKLNGNDPEFETIKYNPNYKKIIIEPMGTGNYIYISPKGQNSIEINMEWLD